MTSQLSLYNSALRRCNERKISALTDNVPARFHLDAVWDEDPIQLMLEKYLWKFARRTMEWNYNPAYTPDFGHQYAFDKPSDYVRLVAISADENFSEPLRNYDPENGFWYADFETIYIKYVSNDSDYGKDYSKWTKLFESMVACYLAYQLAVALNKSDSDLKRLEHEMNQYRKEAANLDAMEDPTRFPTQGTWTRSRRGSPRGDSNRGPLIG